MRTLKEQEERERHRHQVVKRALEAADRIILEGSDGTVEETRFLTAEVAGKMMERALLPFNTEMLRKDLE